VNPIEVHEDVELRAAQPAQEDALGFGPPDVADRPGCGGHPPDERLEGGKGLRRHHRLEGT
jgi:hypothetical protein